MVRNTKRVVLITAGAKGIGRALTQAFSEKEDKVYFVDVQHHQSSAATYKPAAHAKPYLLTPKDHAQHPVGRVGVPEDIANMALFLADNELSGFITGHNFVVDGGMTKKMIYV